MNLSRKNKKKLLIPVFLICFFVFVLGLGTLRKINFNFQFLLPQQEMINPLPTPTEKEKFQNLLGQHNLQPQTLIFSEKTIEATFPGELQVLFSKEKDLKTQVASLQYILLRAKIEGRLPKKIDLRFDKTVVSY